MVNKIHETIVNGERIFLKKSKYFGWGVVYPFVVDGKKNWKNILAGGSWWKLVSIVFLVAIILGCVYEYSNAAELANNCMAQLKLYKPF